MVCLQSFVLTFILIICLRGWEDGDTIIFLKIPIMDVKGEKFSFMALGRKKEIKVIQCIDSLLFYKLAQTRFTT